MKQISLSFFCIILVAVSIKAQPARFPRLERKVDPVVQKLVNEASNNSQLKQLAHELMDKIGPRLVGSSKMQQANDWAVAKYNSWGIEARNEKWGEWRGWERGITHIDMVAPWVRSLESTQLAWSPNTKGKTVSAEVILFPDLTDSLAYAKWMPSVKGKFVLVNMAQPTGRSDANWKEFGTENSIGKMNAERVARTAAWNQRLQKSGYTANRLSIALEKAGAAGILTSYWSRGFGVNKIFGAVTKTIPTLDISLEDYGLVYRLVDGGTPVRLNIQADSKETGMQPCFNTIGEIKGTEKPNEYILLSAHFDSWDGATGATDNGTGTLVMMETMRILKQIVPHPKRTILVGHWGSEEQGLNGSRAFVEDHPEIIKNLHASFNQDNGTGRVQNISGQGFLYAYEYLQRWLAAVPDSILSDIKTTFPGFPGGGGSDYASFVAAGAPGFSLSSLSWDYGIYTWHTNRDTYDKIVFDDVQKNVILTAILAYMASEDPSFFNREKSVLPLSPFTGQPGKWPTPNPPTRKGGIN